MKLLVMIIICVWIGIALFGCVATSGGYRAELYSKPAGSYESRRDGYAQARPLVWVWAHDSAGGSDAYYPVHAARIAEQMLIGCGFSSAGVAVASSYRGQMSPPHQFRLDLKISEESPAFYADDLGHTHEYRAVRVDARLMRAADNTLMASGQGRGAYGADGRAHDIVQARGRIYASAFVALQKATEGAVRSVCHERRSEYHDAPSLGAYPYDAPYGQTLCGYGASGRVTKSGAWDMRYDCRRY